MMEVIPINTNENTNPKEELGKDWIRVFRESGLSRKDWCQQNKIPLSTLSYWIRKSQPEAPEAERTSDLVVAKLPSEQELQFPEQKIIPLQSSFRKISGLRLMLTVRPDC